MTQDFTQQNVSSSSSPGELPWLTVSALLAAANECLTLWEKNQNLENSLNFTNSKELTQKNLEHIRNLEILLRSKTQKVLTALQNCQEAATFSMEKREALTPSPEERKEINRFLREIQYKIFQKREAYATAQNDCVKKAETSEDQTESVFRTHTVDYAPWKSDQIIQGNYRLERLLGRGGSGEAWLATDLHSGKDVVCKRFLPVSGRCIREKEMLDVVFPQIQRLIHPNICPTFSLEEAPNSVPFFVMAYASGGTLDTWFRNQPNHEKGLPLAQILPILSPIADALDYIHENGIIHRDVKPKNIVFFEPEHTPCLVDFGTAARINDLVSMSGSFPFMPPEQWNGKLQDGTTDQYALAVTAWLLLSGHLPFEPGNSLSLLKLRVLTTTPPHQPQFSAETNAALQRALSKNRRDRFSKCRDFIQSLSNGQ